MIYTNSFLVLLPQSLWSLFIIMFVGYMVIKTIRYHNSNKPKLPPGPKPLPIVGNLFEILANRPTHAWIYRTLKEMNTEIICFRLINIHIIVVNCPTIALEFFKKHESNFASRPDTMAGNIISNGYLTTLFGPYAEQWKKMKKITVKDLLSPSRHQWLLEKRNEESDNLIFYLYNKCKNGSMVNTRIAMLHYCSNVFKKMFFNTRYIGKGLKDGGPGAEDVEHVDATLDLLRYVFSFSLSDFIPCLSLLDLDGHKDKVNNALRIVNKCHDPIIEERIKHWNDGSKKVEEDLLDVLINLKDENNNPLLTMNEIKAQVIELMMATLDNPSNAVEWILAEMLNQPELLQRATEELDTVVGKDRLVEESDIPKLKFLMACARESFRLHPVTDLTPPRYAINDAVVGNYLIPKGSYVFLGRTGLGRNPKTWSEPNKFIPERHLKNDGSDITLREPDLRFITFTAGRRSCPGTLLGTTVTIMLLARLLQGFTWSIPSNIPRINLAEAEGMLFPADPLMAIAKPRLAEELYNFGSKSK